MFEPPEHSHDLGSIMLSEVLRDIGVTETMVMKRRRAWMINEAMMNTAHLLLDKKLTSHYFGSQSEASTTLGLKSDVDQLFSLTGVQVIQDLSQWQPDKAWQYLMVQDETVSPGYCLLQQLRQDAPLPEHDVQDKIHSKDSRGRVLLRHSFCLGHAEGPIHGPAASNGVTGFYDRDTVVGLYCQSWPKEAICWLLKQSISGWPNELIKILSAVQGCFVVPVGSRKGLYQDLEWRISTSLAERYLMYSLNITQIRCYILMKMVLKKFLKPKCGEAVSSFMCKNILFYHIAGSEVNSTWNEGSLLTQLNWCLKVLLFCIQREFCQHFVIHKNNLLAGKLSADMKRGLRDVMCTITGNIEQSLLSIQIDDLGQRLRHKLCGISILNIKTAGCDFSSPQSFYNFVIVTQIPREKLGNTKFNAQYLVENVNKLDQLYRKGGDFEKVAVCLLKPFFCSAIGSIKAAEDIQHSRNISPDAREWFSQGLNSDVSSSRLKLAAALYCAGDMKGCEIILEVLSQKMVDTIVQSSCSCTNHPVKCLAEFRKLCYEKDEELMKHNMAFCVAYIQCEINCIPHELKYEMFRSTEQDRRYRDQNLDNWMDLAVVDSKPYLYFLQYKIYSQLHSADQYRALDNLARTIETDPNIAHRETALNLLGQCMEQKNWLQVALYCYKRSLTIRRRKNAANWHVCKLLARLVRSRLKYLKIQ